MNFTPECAVDLCIEPAPCFASNFEALFRLRACTLLRSVQLASALSRHPALLLTLKLSSASVHELYSGVCS